ncbi:MAG: hypothetical protein JOZ62_10860 [Acidobacteriaceae bacterium]|nr:hypothetical protein [Acidobacteriaceae bacterium]
MTRERFAKFTTIALMLGAVVFFLARRSGARPEQQQQPKRTPQDTIYAMLDAARSGDIRTYLAQYTGQMQGSLRQIEAEKGPAAFRDYLRGSAADIKGVAVSEAAPASDREAQIRVEYVYQDRNEAQLAYLEKVSGEWKIARVDSTERVKTLVPYGTPVQ